MTLVRGPSSIKSILLTVRVVLKRSKWLRSCANLSMMILSISNSAINRMNILDSFGSLLGSKNGGF